MAKLILISTMSLALITCQVLSRPLDPADGQLDEGANPTGAPATSGQQQIDWADDEPEEYHEPVSPPSMTDSKQGDDYEGDDEDEVCAICRDDFVDNPPLDITCGHKYHPNCVKMYLTSMEHQQNCCLCRKPIQLKDGSDLLETLFRESRLEVIHNKLKLGVIAGYKNFPGRWESEPRTWSELGLYW